MTMDQRYRKALHKMQSAIAWLIHHSDGQYKGASPKHLRVGINSLKAEQAALAHMLIERGLFTLKEYQEAMTVALEHEAESNCDDARAMLNLPDGTKFL